MRILPLLLFPYLLQAAPPDLVIPPADAVKGPSGLAHKLLQPGRPGPSPKGDDIVLVHFSGWDVTGKSFGNTRSEDHPRSLVLDRLMAGMREALGTMTPGEARRIWIPESLAFTGMAGKPKGPLVMDLEFFEGLPHPSRPPADLARPVGAEALHPKRITSRVLKPGSGTAHPRVSDWVSVRYSGWTTDGKLFDSTLTKGSYEVFRLRDTIQGWREGIPLMVVGERRRFWIPERLAYQGEEGKPAGTLVFDVELLDFRK